MGPVDSHDGLRELLASAPEKRPVKSRAETLRIAISLLPRRGCSIYHRIPSHAEKRVAVVVPGGVELPNCTGFLSFASEDSNIGNGLIEIGKDAIPVVHAWTHHQV